MSELIRKFDSGATRDTEDGKYDYEGFLSPLVLTVYAEYMHKHRVQPDGSLRSGDNWQKGIPRSAYAKSAFRHFIAFWRLHRGYGTWDERGVQVQMEEALCALMFNVMGYLHECLKGDPK